MLPRGGTQGPKGCIQTAATLLLELPQEQGEQQRERVTRCRPAASCGLGIELPPKDEDVPIPGCLQHVCRHLTLLPVPL